MKTFIATLLALVSTSTFAHTGHLTDDSIHGLLHIEHIVILIFCGIVAYLFGLLRK